MLFPQEDAPLLKAWIVKRLENTSDADGDVLADYVLALLCHDGTTEDVRKLCEAEVPDFLNEDSSVFVQDVFNAIQFKAYLPGGAPRPNPAAPPQGLPYDDTPSNQEQPVGPGQNGSRKRSYGDVEMQDTGDYRSNGGRPFKQFRGGRGGRFDPMAGFGRGAAAGGFPGAGGYPPLPQQPPFGTGLSGAAPAFDPANAMESFMKLQNFAQLPPMPGFPQQSQQRFSGAPRRRQLCRDYDTKGYCARGNSCHFEHPTDSIFVPPPGSQGGEEYDPNSAGMLGGRMDLPTPVHANQPFQMGGRNPRSPQQRRQNRRGRAPFSADGPVNDKTKSTIVVESIPEDHFTEDAVRGFFGQFGNIVEISMQPYKHLAIVKFDSWNAANAAYRSPKVIFENRFVKVFWYKDVDASKVPPQGAAGQNGSDPAANGTGGEEIDMEEFLRKQDEAQKIFEEKQQKAQELERQREEIEIKRQELVAKQQEEKHKLLAAIAKKSGASTTPTDDTGKPASKPTSQTEALRAQLAALEAEAKQLGLDPDAAMAEDDESGWTPGYRGGRGRGRGGFFPAPRGRGGFTPRGSFRGGGFRGGRGGGPAAYAAYSLDNRPKKVAITGVDFTESDKGEMLRQYLFGVGEFTNIEETPTTTQITFNDRKTAEKFFYGIPNKQIPGIEGQVETAWVNNDGKLSTPPVAASKPAAVAGKGPERLAAGGDSAGTQAHQNGQAKPEDTAMANAGNQNGVKKPNTVDTGDDDDIHIITESRRDDSRMDYDVADDDNQWNE